MDPSFLMDRKTLLEENNRGKRGHPYTTPNAFITFLAKLRAVYNVPFRSPVDQKYIMYDNCLA